VSAIKSAKIQLAYKKDYTQTQTDRQTKYVISATASSW